MRTYANWGKGTHELMSMRLFPYKFLKVLSRSSKRKRNTTISKIRMSKSEITKGLQQSHAQWTKLILLLLQYYFKLSSKLEVN